MPALGGPNHENGPLSRRRLMKAAEMGGQTFIWKRVNAITDHFSLQSGDRALALLKIGGLHGVVARLTSEDLALAFVVEGIADRYINVRDSTTGATLAFYERGGRGTRLRPLTDDLPKCLAPVGGRPFLEYVIELYARQGIRDLALCSGYLAERIVDAVGNGSRWGVTIQHSIEPAPLGTIGALRYAAAVLHETFVLSYGDIYPAMPVARLIEKSRTVEQP